MAENEIENTIKKNKKEAENTIVANKMFFRVVFGNEKRLV